MRQHVWSSEVWPLSKLGYSLILVVNVVGELQQKRTLAASRGFLAAARLSCIYIFLLRVLDKAEYSAFESTLNSSIVSYRIMPTTYTHAQ